MELIERVRDFARRLPGRVAFRAADGGAAQTYADLAAAIDRAADDLGGEPVVGIVAGNRVGTPATILGALAAGARVLLVLPTSTRLEREDLGRRAGVTRWLGDDTLPTSPAGGPTVAELLLATSGSTGRPKVVCRDVASLDRVSANMVEAIGVREEDEFLACVPLAHSYGIEHGLLAPLRAGAGVTLFERFDLQHLDDATRRVPHTIWPAVPAMLERLLATPLAAERFAALRRLYSAGGRLPASIATAFRDRYGQSVGQLYGSTEIGSVTFAAAPSPEADGANVGQPMRGVEFRVDDDGQLLARSPSMFRGYLDEPADLRDGFFATGDLGHVSAAGELIITGRLKRLIETGGAKVDPAEVERLLESHPAVRECAVVGVRQSDVVSRLRAFVVLRGDASPAALREFVRARLAAYKVPREVVIADALPRLATGKIDLRQLEERA